MPNNKDNINRTFSKFKKLKQYFNILPSIETLEEYSSLFNTTISVTHKFCNYSETITLKEWVNKKNISIDENNPYLCFCSHCLNKVKTKELQEYIAIRYHNDFEVVGQFTGRTDKIEVKHKKCNEVFLKTPLQLKNETKRLYCPHCKESDSVYEQSVIDAKNKELQLKFEQNNITTYIPLEDCIGITKKMRFKHLTCDTEFNGTAYDICNYYAKSDHCPNCFKNKKKNNENNTSDEYLEKRARINLMSKYRKFVKYSEEFIFEPKIESFGDFELHFEDVLTITHKSCNTSVQMTFSQWSKQRFYKDTEKTQSEFVHFCEHCSEILNREKIQNFLDKNYNKEFKVVSKYKGAKKDIKIEHITCGATFSIITHNIKRNDFSCRECGKKDKKTETAIQKKKNKELIRKLKKEKLKGFTPLEDIQALTKSIKFRHERCGCEFDATPQSILRLKNKVLCSHCPEKLLQDETDTQKRTELAQKALDIINGPNFNIVDSYDDDGDIVVLSHNSCSGEFPVSKRNLFNKNIECPHCESNNFKNNIYISLKNKIKAFEDYLDNEYSILKPFMGYESIVPIQHKSCGHVFERTISAFVRSKGKLLCPNCRHQEKVKEVRQKLHNKYQDEFECINIDEYKSVRTEMKFKHNTCGTVFESNFDKMLLHKTSPCPNCNPDTKSDTKFKNELYNKFKGEYLLVGKYEGHTKKTSFRHKKCNRLFVKTPYNVLNSDIPCSHCLKENTLLGLKKAQEKIRQNSGDLFTINGIYRGIKKEIPVTCNACKTVFMSTPKKMFTRKKCPHCKATEIKKD